MVNILENPEIFEKEIDSGDAIENR